MGDMSQVIVPKSDQINADDLLSGSMTIKVTSVKVASGQEQPVSMFFDGSTKAYRPCKSMARVLVTAWGADSSKYVGRSLTLYCDPKVKWGGMEVGGIRISHMSHIESPLTMALTVTRANKKPFTVRPLTAAPEKSSASPSESGAASRNETLRKLCNAAGVQIKPYLDKAEVDSADALTEEDYVSLCSLLARKAKPADGATL